MHKKYGSRGVACVSVSIDEKDRTRAVQAFLTKQNATFANYQLNVEQDVWIQKFNVRSPPAVFVFDKEGRLAQRFDTEDGRRFTYEDVEKRVRELLGSESKETGQAPVPR